jgi:hypothetical protein
MSARRSRKAAQPETPDLEAAAKDWSGRKDLSGSDSGHFTLALANQVWRSLFHPEGTPEWIVDLGQMAALGALKGIAPRDCQTARNFDPQSASNVDPGRGCPGSA